MIRQSRLTSNQIGMGLIEVMVAAGIMAVVSLLFATLFTDMHKAQNSTKFRADADTFEQEVRSHLSSEAACTESFQNLLADVGAAHAVSTLKNVGGADKYPVGPQLDGNRTLHLESWTLGNYQPGTAVNKGTMTLSAGIQTAKIASGPQNIKRSIEVAIERNGANQITSCVALAKMSDGLWQRSGLNLGDIFFNSPAPGGKVGIGTPTPQANLHLASSNPELLIKPSAMTFGDAAKISFVDPDGGTGPMSIQYHDIGPPALALMG